MSRVPLVVAVVLAVGSFLLAGFVALRTPDATPDLAARVDALQARLERLEREAARRDPVDPPTLLGLEDVARARSRVPGEEAGGRADPAPAPPGRPAASPETPDPETLEQIVEEVVGRKAAELRWMQANKKPTVDQFATRLDLDPEQRRVVEREVVAVQHEIKDLLEIETDDGTNFLDELVEVLADGVARPGQDPERGKRLFGRILSENVPGTNETYATRIDAAKARLRETLRRELSRGQWATLDAWQMDLTEIQGIPGSPWAEVEQRVRERAGALGADLPPR